jgi:hypothetical protein
LGGIGDEKGGLRWNALAVYQLIMTIVQTAVMKKSGKQESNIGVVNVTGTSSLVKNTNTYQAFGMDGRKLTKPALIAEV